ncbi:MAG: type I restriction endonuclease subunit R [Ardenticatenaceae bacterium]|nr:type I restriction endonuclease subunit R [Ardenticatenaceae bacterium]MCB8990276.1 type I restriction endonuclease subunit R [Ardenticatenaceae bacterium]
MIQSEAELENSLIDRLTTLGYSRVTIHNVDALYANLKRQLEIHNAAILNGVPLSDGEFAKILNHLNKGSIFDRAKTLRGRFQLARDDGSSIHIQFLDLEQWCQNQYQVANQITVKGRYKNRYDVTLLINGLPLVQIELKRRGMEMKEAFNQINRYQRHSFWAASGLFQYVQLFVISNGVNSKYLANNRNQSFKQTFYWADADNNKVTQLDDFADQFLEKCHLSKMISQHIVLHESTKTLMVLRPYQYHAVEAILDRVKTGPGNGYIWHTTGSGKTLTSFKAAQILTALPDVDKVIFVVDRADLDYQTTKEFNHFSPDSVDGTDNTRQLVKQMTDDTALIVTTIQKLNTAISRARYQKAVDALRDQRIVFIFDECHRSQFGDTHKRIVKFFKRAQMFGFTGTPIFADNAVRNVHGKRTTTDLFDKCLHRYVITDAIADDNVLKFSIEYWGKLKRKDGSLIDEQVHGINRKEFFENPKRVDNIVDWILANHGRKTHNRKFAAILCVGSTDMLVTYYETFQRKKAEGLHNLRVATIFTFQANEEDADANGYIHEPDFDMNGAANESNAHKRDKLASYVADYNAMFGSNESVKDGRAFYTYYRQIAKRMKARDTDGFPPSEAIDILLVVNMFLTGFDAKTLNTLYVDKNLKYHGLIQAYSRTNRTLDQVKSQGNIVCFRNLKGQTDTAVALFSDKDAQEAILIRPYEEYIGLFNQYVRELYEIAETPTAVDDLIREDDQLTFVQKFREMMRTLNVLKSFTEFSWEQLEADEQEFEDYKSKYLDIYDRVRTPAGEGASIIDDVDFELELIQRDEINVAYILNLLARMHRAETADQYNEAKKSIIDLLGQEPRLRSKRELIERFISDYMPHFEADTVVEDEFVNYWTAEQEAALNALCEAEGMNREAVDALLRRYRFTGKRPLRNDVFAALNFKPKVLERKPLYERIIEKLITFVHTFDEGMGDL